MYSHVRRGFTHTGARTSSGKTMFLTLRHTSSDTTVLVKRFSGVFLTGYKTLHRKLDDRISGGHFAFK